MAAITKKETRLKLQFVANTDHSIHAGLVAVEAMAGRFGLWEKVRRLSCLDPRRDKKRGYSPEVIIGQLIYALCSGGGCLSDSEALNEDPLAGQREVFFDDTQLEVRGKQFEGAAINYNGDLALSWQTLWVGPFLCDSHLGSPKDVSDQLVPMLERNRSLWKGQPAHFYADSGSSAGAYLDAIADEGWHYTVSYNKWTSPLERKALELPALAWKRTGEEDHALLRHQPEGRKAPQLFAAVKWQDDLFERFGFIACDEAQTNAARVFERHHLKGAKEQLFKEVLSGLDLHRPPCLALLANQIYYLIGGLAYNLMMAIKVLDLKDEQQGWQLKTLMKKLVFLPGRLSQRSRQWVARVMVPGAWLNWWQRLTQHLWPNYGPGRPVVLANTA